MFGHFWTILSSHFVTLGPRLTIFHRLPDHQGKSRASFEPPTLEFCDCFTCWSLQPLNFATVFALRSQEAPKCCTVVNFGLGRPQNAVLSSILLSYVRLCSVMFGSGRPPADLLRGGRSTPTFDDNFTLLSCLSVSSKRNAGKSKKYERLIKIKPPQDRLRARTGRICP